MIGGVLRVCEEWKFMCESKVWRDTSSLLLLQWLSRFLIECGWSGGD